MPLSLNCSRNSLYVSLILLLLFLTAACGSQPEDRPRTDALVPRAFSNADDTIHIRVYTGDGLLGGEQGGTTCTYEVHFIDVGQGDAILVLTSAATMLVDAGPVDGNVTDYLRSLDIAGIDLVFATHPHADHIGGMPQLIASFPIGEIIDPGVVHTTLTYRNYLKSMDDADIPYTVGREGLRRSLGDSAFAEIIHPADPDEDRLNDASLVIRVVLGNITLLLTGDIERRSEEELLASGRLLQSNILKVPHHGSSTSSHRAFLEAVGPETGIIMCGFLNPFGNPHWQTLASLDASGAMVWRTDRNGHIIIRSDGHDYLVEVTRDGPPEKISVDINTATAGELEKIIHIGPERAAQIIRLRPFESVDDLIRVDGIGSGRLKDIKRQNIARAGDIYGLQNAMEE